MALTDETVKQLIQQLETDRAAYLASHTKLHDALIQVVSQRQTASTLLAPNQPIHVRSKSFESDRPHIKKPASVNSRRTLPNTILDGQSNIKSSLYDSDSFDSDGDESFFAQDPLPTSEFDEDNLRHHLEHYEFNNHSKFILEDLLNSPSSRRLEDLSPDAKLTGSSDASRTEIEVYEVGDDGSPLQAGRGEADVNYNLAVWNILRCINVTKDRKQAVGRIIIMREPSPLMFGALHLTLNKCFDMESIYRMLIDRESTTKAYIKGYMSRDERRQRSIVFCFKYHTLIGEKKVPLPWQKHDFDLESKADNVPISTCSSVVALSLGGKPVKKIRRKSRKLKNPADGAIYDQFAPWQILSLQCFPDWHSDAGIHETSHHYVNGPDAFLATLLQEYRDATKRFKLLNRHIVALATPLREVIFNSQLRDKLLFESDEYTYSRRYFWASQTLGLLGDEMEAMIAAYKETFTDEVWSGEHKILFPGTADQSARYANWRKKMSHMRKLFETEIANLQEVLKTNIREQKDIKGLREWLFSGTSVLESREAVKQASITVEQGYNIKLLTLVTIFYLPLMFVTSVFGMTNMPPEDSFVPFGIAVACLCFPTYIMIGAINNPDRLRAAVIQIGYFSLLSLSCLPGYSDKLARYKDKYMEKSDHDGLSDREPHNTNLDRKISTMANNRQSLQLEKQLSPVRASATASNTGNGTVYPHSPPSSSQLLGYEMVGKPVYTHTGRRPSALQHQSTIRFDIPMYRNVSNVLAEETAAKDGTISTPNTSQASNLERIASDPPPRLNDMLIDEVGPRDQQQRRRVQTSNERVQQSAERRTRGGPTARTNSAPQPRPTSLLQRWSSRFSSTENVKSPV